ncbi:hypothetical protein [Parafrankia sp. BMG5.11]|uniref:hypothetical protein n=1 Tax=Parafrankia sp. BMG5.11 TaxID=222540 RepID=UPI00103960F4|nr:hypothetical protein [Parafrankia sp. BMG5.11]TCJ39509.1 hypothetical protein E0504_10410 [Parafrankia sp. BMG5.11]
MSHAEIDQTAVEDPFSFTLDQYGRIWLHTKLEGIEVAIDLAEKDVAFDIMADKSAASSIVAGRNTEKRTTTISYALEERLNG